MRKTPPVLSTGLTCAAALLIAGCANMHGANGAGNSEPSVIGCDDSFEDVMSNMMRLHDRLGISGEQEFAWIAYETAYERYADARRFRELDPDNGIPSREDGLRPLRERVREARDELYRTLNPDQETYLDMEACRLSFP